MAQDSTLKQFGVETGELAAESTDESPTSDEDDGRVFDEEDRSEIKHHTENGDLAPLLFTLDLTSAQFQATIQERIKKPSDLVEWYDENGGFEGVDHIGPVTSERIEAAVPHIRDVVEINAQEPCEASEEAGSE